MKEEQKLLPIDVYEEGAIISGLNELRNKGLANQEPTDFVDDLMLKVIHTPSKKVRVFGAPAESRRDFVGRGGATEQADFCRDSGETSKRSPRRRDEAR